MGKRVYRWSARPKKANVGCMWSLLRLLDFRRSPRLLLSQEHGSAKYAATGCSRVRLSNFVEINDKDEKANESKVRRINLGMPSVKTLIEEEMASAQPLKIPSESKKIRSESKKIPGNEVEKLLSDLGRDVHRERGSKQTKKKSKTISEFYVNDLTTPGSFDDDGYKNTSPTEEADLDFVLAAFLVEIYRFHNECQHVDCKNKMELCPSLKFLIHMKLNDMNHSDSNHGQENSNFQKAMVDVAEAYKGHEFDDEEHLNGSKAAQSKEFMNALEILSSNKELFLKLLQNPNSHILKNIQNIHNIQGISKSESGRFMEGNKLVDGVGSSEKCQEFSSRNIFTKQRRYNFFWNRDKPKERRPSGKSDSSKSISRIVVLKPSSARMQNPVFRTNLSSLSKSHNRLQVQEDSERVASHFSLKEIKRRLRHVIGEPRKEQHLISTKGPAHRVPNGFKDSATAYKQLSTESSVTSLASRTSSDSEDDSEPPGFHNNFLFEDIFDNNKKPNDCKHDIKNDISSSGTGSFFYKEAKRHLIEILNTGNRSDDFPTEHISKSLARLLSLPEYNILSPKTSPGKEELEFSPDESISSSLEKAEDEGATRILSPSRQDMESTKCDFSIGVDEQVVELKPEIIDAEVKDGVYYEEGMNLEGATEIIDMGGIMCTESCSHLDACSVSVGSEFCVLGEGIRECPGLDMLEELEPMNRLVPIFPSSSEIILESLEEQSPATVIEPITSSALIFPRSPESTYENPEEPSPVSVLEQYFNEDIISSDCKTTKHAELPIQNCQTHYKGHDNSSVPLSFQNAATNLRSLLKDKNARFEFVKSVLEDSGLLTDENLDRWYPALCNEVGKSYCESDDSNLLFDCICEVLAEIQERYFIFNPWASYAKRNVRPLPVGGNFVMEVMRGVEWHLQNQFPSTLEQIMRKDLDGGTWMDLQPENESIIIEIWDSTLDDLIEETVFDLWLP
ncbi:uncharacterized protein [Typha latifolia]|uniref:uncharacterized protein n=1 Tax=Typha latifolia TaxID=4733 RepID=UPI003C2C025C